MKEAKVVEYHWSTSQAVSGVSPMGQALEEPVRPQDPFISREQQETDKGPMWDIDGGPVEQVGSWPDECVGRISEAERDLEASPAAPEDAILPNANHERDVEDGLKNKEAERNRASHTSWPTNLEPDRPQLQWHHIAPAHTRWGQK